MKKQVVSTESQEIKLWVGSWRGRRVAFYFYREEKSSSSVCHCQCEKEKVYVNERTKEENK